MTKDARNTGRNHRERRPHRLLIRSEFDFVVDRICKYFRIGDEAQLWHRFKGNVSHNTAFKARQCVLHICWTSFDADYSNISKFFDLPKPASFTANRQVEEWRQDNPELDKFLTSVEEDIIRRRITANVQTP